MKRLATLAILAAALTAAADVPALDTALAGRTAGAPVSCLTNSQAIDGPQILDSRTLLYRQGRRVWVNRLEGACPGLTSDSFLVVDVFGGQLCRNDHFRAVLRGSSIPGPVCRFGMFVPYDRAPK